MDSKNLLKQNTKILDMLGEKIIGTYVCISNCDTIGMYRWGIVYEHARNRDF
jgi:hypothetical protein